MLRRLLVILVAIVGLSLFACRPSTQTNSLVEATAKSTISTRQAESKTVVADVVTAVQPIPGLARSSQDISLDAEAANVDPNADGWTTEAFNENALAQLKKLAKWLEHGGVEVLPNVFADRVLVSDLRPDQVTTVYDEAGFRIQRWEPGESDAKPTADSSLLPEFQALLVGNEDVHAELKIIGIVVADRQVLTRVRCHFSGANEKFRYQQNAAWGVHWNNTDSASPLISAIELLEFEEVQTSTQTLFVDRTAAAFQQEPIFRPHLNYSLDYWRDRLDWRFGWLVVGAHGLAVGDANGDGLEDVYVTDTGGLPNRLLIQQPDGTVRDASQEMGVDVIEPAQAALFLDLDNDGDQDLLVSVARFVLVFENNGRGKFLPHRILQSSSMMRSLAAVDFDKDGLLDVYACGYSLRNPGDAVGLGRPLPYHDANNGAPNYLMRNAGNFEFTDVTGEVGLHENNSRFSYAAAWEDFDNDGDLDLYVANDFGRNNLYRNDNGRFSDIAAEAGVEDIAAGMSVSWGDFNGDGLPDLYVGNMFSSAGNRIAYQRQFRQDIDEKTRAMYQRHARGNSLFQNMGDGTFRDVSQQAGVTEARWAWSSNFADINNDGRQDILVGNGMVTGTDDSGDL